MEQRRAQPGHALSLDGEDVPAERGAAPSLHASEPESRQAAPELLRSVGGCVSCGSREEFEEEICAHCGCARVAGNYRIVRVLAQSARGRVYETVDSNGYRRALKEMVFATVPDVPQLEQFHRESRVLRALDHPAIPHFVDSFQTGRGVRTRLFLAQEFVDGENLLSRLKRGRFDEPQAKDVAVQVLRILEYLHAQTPRLIHRDIKPANLILRPGGEVALVDFDAARAIHAQRTHGASLAGTFGYMPFEQLGGTVDATSDLYALGATLIHLLSGKAPQEMLGPSLQLQFEEHTQTSRGFSGWLRRQVARDHQDRFASAAEAAAALRAIDLRANELAVAGPLDGAATRAIGDLQIAEAKEDRRQRLYRRAAIGGTIGLGLTALGAAAFFLNHPLAWAKPHEINLASRLSPQDAILAERFGELRMLRLGTVPLIWNAPFGKVTVLSAVYDPRDATRGLRVHFVISPIPAAGFESALIQAHLEGPAGRIEADLLHDMTYEQGADSLSLEQVFPYALNGKIPPNMLVVGDTLRVPLQFAP